MDREYTVNIALQQLGLNALDAPSQGHVMLLSSEKHLDMLNELVNLHSKFGYYIFIQTYKILHFICRRDGITDKHMDKWTEDPITRCPWWTSGQWHKNIKMICLLSCRCNSDP